MKRARKSWKLYESLHADNARLKREVAKLNGRERHRAKQRVVERGDERFVERLYARVLSGVELREIEKLLREHLVRTVGEERSDKLKKILSSTHAWGQYYDEDSGRWIPLGQDAS